jgi:NADPH2:quinone reductase
LRAIFFDSFGGPDVLSLREVAEPSPLEDQALVEVKAVGVNYRDVYERAAPGYGAALPPAILGVEGAGLIRATGERVAWMSVPGSYAEQIAAPRARLVRVPEEVSFEVAAALLMQGITAHYLANDSYPIDKGDWVVVHAAAGGVGLLLTQLASRRGGRVIATTSAGKEDLAREAGAEEVIPYDDFDEAVLEITDGAGVAAVYDGIGRATFAGGLRALHDTGRMILYGAASGAVDSVSPADLAGAGSIYLQRPTVATYTRNPQMLRDRAGELFDMVANGELVIRIGSQYPLTEARQAHEDLEARKTTGKSLLIP